MSKLNWNPVLKGITYCSSACGRGCTKSEYDTAVQEAKTLAALLQDSRSIPKSLNKKWNVRIWENLGWHWQVISACNRITVSYSYGSYSASIKFANEADHVHKFTFHGRTPQAAIKKLVKYSKQIAEQTIKDYTSMVEGL